MASSLNALSFSPAPEAQGVPTICHSSSCCAELALTAAGVRVGGTEVGQQLNVKETSARQLMSQIAHVALG